MKKGTGLFLILSFFALAIIVVVVKSYTKLTTVNTEVINKESDINVQLSRKMSQVNNFVELNNKYLIDDGSILNNLINETNEFLSLEDIDLKCEKNNKISELLNSFFAEISKELLENEEVKTAINDILSTEKRIETAKNNYNTAVNVYNKQIKKFPSSIISSIRGFKEKKEFEVSVKVLNILEEE